MISYRRWLMPSFLIISFLVFPAPTILGQIWISSSSGLWSDPDNWSGGVPVSSPTTQLAFENRLPLVAPQMANNDVASPFQFQSIALQARYGYVPFNAPYNSLTISGSSLQSAATTGVIDHQTGAAFRFESAIDSGSGLNLIGSSNGHLQIVQIAGNGPVSIQRTGRGHLVLVNNTTSGGVVLNSGELSLDNSGSLGSGTLTVNGGSLRMNSFVGPSGIEIANQAILNSDLNISGNNSVLMSGVLSGSGGVVNRSIAGITLRMTAANTYSGHTVAANTPTLGGTTIQLQGTDGSIMNSSGITVARLSTFALDNSDSLGSFNANRVADTTSVNLRGGTFRFTGSGTVDSSETVGLLSAESASTINVSAGSASNRAILTAVGYQRLNRGTTTLAGTGVGTGPLSSPGVGTLILNDSSGFVADMVGGGGSSGSTTISINPSFIAAPSGGAVNSTWTTYDQGVRPLDLATEYTNAIVDGSTSANNVRLTNSTATINSATTINSLILSNTLGPVAYGSVTGLGTLTITSGGLMSAVSGAGTGAPPTIAVATLDFGNREAVVHVTSGNASPLQIDSTILGSGGLTKSGNGILRLNGNALYAGTLTVNAGTIEFDDSAKLGGTGAVVLNGGTLRNTTAMTLSRDITLGLGHGTFSVNAGVDLTLSGNIAGAGGLSKFGAGTLVLTGNNSYSGPTRIGGGTLSISEASNLGTGEIVLAPGATLQNTAALTIQQDMVVVAGAGVRNVQTLADLTFQGNIYEDAAVTNALPLTKTGSASLILNGNNTFRGQMLVNEGSLYVNGFLDQVNSASVGVVVADGAGLGGSGIIARDVLLESGALVLPGASVGTLSIDGAVSFAGDFETFLEFDGNGLDLLAINGLAAFNGGTANLRLVDLGGNFSFATPQIFLSTEGWSGTLPEWSLDFTQAAAYAGTGLRVVQLGNQFAIAIPEPSSAVLIAFCGLVLACRRRKKSDG